MNYFIFLILQFTVGVYGGMLETHSEIKAIHLSFGLYVAALGALASVALWQWMALKTPILRFTFLILLFIIFRVAYFPVMVLSATVACYSEWLLLSFIPVCPVRIFPALFISTVLMFTAVALIASFALQDKRSAWFPVILLLAPMAIISFSSYQDISLLPDQHIDDINPFTEVRLPDRNPYWAGLDNNNLNPAQKLIALAGALLYPLIPGSPWATASKGTLEHAYRSNPSGSSADRLKDHYVAFINAHQFFAAGKTLK